MKISLTLVGVALLGASLTACSGSDGGDGDASSAYCQDIKTAKPIFESLTQGDLAQLEEGFATFHRLADESPDGLKDEWKTLDNAATSVESALKDAGLEFSDLAGIQEGTIPEGVDMTKLTSFAADLQKLNNTAFADARAEIAKQAKATCDVALGAS